MTTADRLREERRVEERVEGRVEGWVEGRVETLLMLLRLRFGAVDSAAESRVRQANSTDELDHWIERVLTATSVDEVLDTV